MARNGHLVELESQTKGGLSGRAFINPASVVSVAVVGQEPDVSYVELVSGNTFRVLGSSADVLSALGLD